MLNLPIKILKTVEIETENIEITIDNIDLLVAEWDAWAKVTSRHLVCIVNARTIDVSDSTTQFLRFNHSDPGDNDYSYQRLSGVGVNDSAGRTDGANAINLPAIPGASNDDVWGGSLFLIPHAFNTVNHKTVLALGGAGEFAVEAVVGRWAQAAAITSVTIIMGVGDEMEVGSTVSIGVIDESYLVAEILDAGGGTFDNIPQGEGDLAIIGYLRSARAAVVEDEVVCAINDDTVAGNYPTQELVGRGGGTAAAQPNFEVGIVAAANATANAFGALAMVISQYTKNNQPHLLSQSGYHELTGATGEVRVMSGRRANIEPVNKLYIAGSAFDDFAAGSLLSLYRVPKRIIERIELTEDTPTIIFDNIPQNFEDLILHVYARSSRAALTDFIRVELNGDGAVANYNLQYLLGAVAGVTAGRALGSMTWLLQTGNTTGAGQYAGNTMLFPRYAKSDRHKHAVALTGMTEARVQLFSCRWENLNPITSIRLTPTNGPNFLAGSVFELEGILRKEGLPPDEGEQWGV